MRDIVATHSPPTHASHVLVYHVPHEPTAERLHSPSGAHGHRAAWEHDPAIGNPYARPSLHPHRRGRDAANGDADRQGLDDAFEAYAARRPKPTDIGHVIAVLRRITKGRPDPVTLAIAAATAELCFDGQEIPMGLKRMFARPSVDDRPMFRSAASVLAPRAPASLGLSTQGSALDRAAVVKGRTRARWDEVACSPTHASMGRAAGLAAVERSVDAARGRERAGLTADEMAAVEDDAAKMPLEERLLRYRERVAGVAQKSSDATHSARALVEMTQAQYDQLPAGFKRSERRRLERMVSSARNALETAIADDRARYVRAVKWATRELSDKEIRKRISDARHKLERSLRRSPARGEELTRETGDRGWMEGLIGAR